MSDATTVTVDNTSAGASNAASWAESLEPEVKQWVGGMGLDKLPVDQALAKVLPMYRGAEQKLGVPADQLLRLPGKDAKPEDWKPVWQKLGAPEKPEGYEIKLPDGADDSFLKQALGWFHELNLPKPQAQALAAKWGEYVNAAQVAEEGKWNERFEQDLAALKQEWGDTFNAKRDLAQRVERTLGLPRESLQAIERALGPKAYQQTLVKFASAIGEHRFEGGEGQKGFGMSPDGAKQRIADLQKDQAWNSAYLAGDADKKAEMTRLMQIAYPDVQNAA